MLPPNYDKLPNPYADGAGQRVVDGSNFVLKPNVDNTDPNNVYVGYRLALGVTGADAGWLIILYVTTGSVITPLYASLAFDQIWDNRTDLNFS